MDATESVCALHLRNTLFSLSFAHLYSEDKCTNQHMVSYEKCFKVSMVAATPHVFLSLTTLFNHAI